MSEYAGRIAVGAIVAVALVVGLAFELNYLVPNSSSLTTASTPFTSGWFGKEAPPSGCGNMTLEEHLTGYRTGYIMDMYDSPRVGQNYVLGSTICFYTYFQNVRNQSSSLPTSETLEVTSSNVTAYPAQNPTDPKTINFETSCPVPAYSGSFGANSTGWNCEVVWDTSQPYNGTLPIAGTPQTNGIFYDATATVTISNSTAHTHTSVAFGLSATPPASTTASSSSSIPALSCPGQTFKLLTPLKTGPLSLKVTTDQGAVVNNNGTVFVTHRATNGTSSNYCLRLQGNATGYVQLSANDGLPQTGTYNVTLFAGYNQGPGYEGAIPSISISTNTAVSVTISLPSGEVYLVTSTQGISSVTTITTTATSIEGNG